MFVPNKFSQYGKSSKDLFKKKYDFDHSIKTINKAAKKGQQIETGVQIPDAQQARGFFKGKYTGFSVGSVFSKAESDFEVYTDAGAESKASIKFNDWAKGLTVTAAGSSKSNDKAFKRPVLSGEVEYSTEYLSTTLTAKSDLDVHRVDGSVSLGYNNISVGGAVTLDVSRGSEVVERNFGAEYLADDFVASLYTEKNSSILAAAYYQRITKDQSLGAQFKYELQGRQERSLAIGTEYRLDLDTVVKAKVELPSGDVAAQLEHRLANPRLLLGVAAQFNAKAQKFAADKLGVSVTFGDY